MIEQRKTAGSVAINPSWLPASRRQVRNMALRLRVTSHHKEELGESGLREFVACGGTIGRGAGSDWMLPDEKRFVSKQHALIDFQAGAYYLIDTSRNGVYINDSDAAVGRGHPQRLFDGDLLRLGEYVIQVELAEQSDSPEDDARRGSIGGAELVPIDESMELQLVDESKLRAFDFNALEPHLTPAPEPPPPPSVIPAPVAEQPPPAGNGPALDIFCRAAGLKPGDLHGSNPDEILETAGLLMRELLIGLAELLQSRSHMKEALRLPQTIIQPAQNNPLKFSAEVADALRYLLGDSGQSYLPADRAVQSAFRDIKNHQQAMFKAMIHAIRDFSERLDPDELRRRFDRGLRRSPLLAGTNKLKYWDLYEETYAVLIQEESGAPLPAIIIDELTRAYEHESESLRRSPAAQASKRPAQAS